MPSGIRGETVDEILWLDQTVTPTEVGMTKLVNGDFNFYDQYGSFNPRDGGGITPTQHKALRDLIHFIDDGPADGFTSGAYKETLPLGNPFPTSEIWWESSAKLKKIVSLDTTWTSSKITQEVWKIYDAAGSVLITLTDAITYSGMFEATRTRTWS